MKRVGIIVLIIFAAFLFARRVVFADYAGAYQTYINSSGNYQSAYNEYLVARANYLASQSLDAQDKAMAATLKMLQARDALTISYIEAIKAKIQSTQGISSADAGTFSGRIDTEAGWYQSHSTKLTSAGSLADLVSDSDDAKAEYNNSTIILIYQSLIVLGVGNNTYIRGEITNEINILQTKLNQIKANQDKDVSIEERSLVDIENKLSRSQAKDSDAINIVNSIKPGDQVQNDFQDAQSDLIDSNLYIQEANQGLLQIITQIKSSN